MTSTRPARILLGALLFTGSFHDASALQRVGDAVVHETFALEKDDLPWRNVGQLFSKKLYKEVGSKTSHLLSKKLYKETFEVLEGLPLGPRCYMRLSSGCPKKSMRTQAWRRDTWAGQHGLDEVGCHKRKHFWEKVCEDAEMLYMSKTRTSEPASTETNTKKIGNTTVHLFSKKHVSKTRSSEAASRETISKQVGNKTSHLFSKKLYKETFEVLEGHPPGSGCYMRLPSGCPKKSMRTQAWRRDTWAGQHGLDEVGCHNRKHFWEKMCEDAEMLYVSKTRSSEPASGETLSKQVGNKTSFERVGNRTNSERAGKETRSKPVSSKTSFEPAGLLQLDDALSWPWVGRHKGESHEKAPSAQAQQALAGAGSDVLVDQPSQHAQGSR